MHGSNRDATAMQVIRYLFIKMRINSSHDCFDSPRLRERESVCERESKFHLRDVKLIHQNLPFRSLKNVDSFRKFNHLRVHVMVLS